MFEVLDQLIGPLSAHITSILSQPASGTDDQLTKSETKKAYLALLNTVMASKLHGVFTSERALLLISFAHTHLTFSQETTRRSSHC